MMKGDTNQAVRDMVIRRLGQLCEAHDMVSTEKALLEVKILETVKVLEQCYLPESDKRPSASLRSASANNGKDIPERV